MALGSGPDSARVNEVAKLCRAVVHGMKASGAPKVLLVALARAKRRMVERLDLQKTRAAGPIASTTSYSVAGQESPFITVCDGLDQAFKGIWWMPWH